PSFDFDDISDVLANTLGYIPVGIVLGYLGPFGAVVTAMLISVLAETSQLAMMHRDPSLTDVLSNTAGAILGAFATTRLRITSPSLKIIRWRGIVAAVLLMVVFLHVRNFSDDRGNLDGVSIRGQIEAYWQIGKVN